MNHGSVFVALSLRAKAMLSIEERSHAKLIECALMIAVKPATVTVSMNEYNKANEEKLKELTHRK